MKVLLMEFGILFFFYMFIVIFFYTIYIWISSAIKPFVALSQNTKRLWVGSSFGPYLFSIAFFQRIKESVKFLVVQTVFLLWRLPVVSRLDKKERGTHQ